MVWFERLSSLAAILYELKTLSHVRIGSGENVKLPTPIDNPQTRILKLEPGKVEGKWIVYIPASSLHGVLRSTLEDYLRTQLDAVDTVKNVKNKCEQRIKNEIEKYSESIPGFEELPLYREVCYTTLTFDNCQVPPPDDKKDYLIKVVGRKTQSGEHLPCFTCQLFGATGLRGRVRMLNAYPSLSTMENLPLDVVTRVGINRVTGAAEEGRLFDLEAIPPGAVFYFFVVINNPYEEMKLHSIDQSSEDKYKQKYGKSYREYVIEQLGISSGSLNYIGMFEKSIELVSKGLVPIGAHGTVGFGNVEISELARFKAKNEDEVRKFVKALTKKNVDIKELSCFLKVNECKKDKIPELSEDLYPWLARAIAKLAKTPTAPQPQGGAGG